MSYDNDHLYDELTDLINTEINPKTGQTFKGWYMRSFYTLGKDEVLRLASITRADAKTDKKRYFSTLLSRAVKRVAAKA